MYQNGNFFSKKMMVFMSLCAILCLISFFWLSFTARRFNLSGVFYFMYYAIMYISLCITITGLWLKGLFRFGYPIAFLLGVVVGFLLGSFSWVLSIIINDYSGSLKILNDGVSEFFNYIFFHILVSSALTLDFLIGALSTVLGKYILSEFKAREN